MHLARTAWVAAVTVAIIAAAYVVFYAPTAPSGCVTDQDCMAGGCSGQVCTTAANARNIITTCEWSSEYDCLRLTSCGCVNGTCAWRNTDEYQNCLNNLLGD